jgi:hypothetical protein
MEEDRNGESRISKGHYFNKNKWIISLVNTGPGDGTDKLFGHAVIVVEGIWENDKDFSKDSTDNLSSSSEKTLEKSLSNKNKGYVCHEVLGDGDCGYNAFGINRKEAYQLLRANLIRVREILKPVVSELLIKDEFYNYLIEEGHINANVAHQSIVDALERFSTDLNVLQGFIDYDVRDKKIDMGWAHPATLQALACIRGITLYIWQLGQNGELIPHNEERYVQYVHPENTGQRTDLLFLNENHFERLEFFGFENTVPVDTDLPVCPLKIQKRAPGLFFGEYDITGNSFENDNSWQAWLGNTMGYITKVRCNPENHLNAENSGGYDGAYRDYCSKQYSAKSYYASPEAALKMIRAIEADAATLRREIDLAVRENQNVVWPFTYQKAGSFRWSIWGGNGGDNCITWAEGKLAIAGVGNGKVVLDSKMASTEVHVSRCKIM